MNKCILIKGINFNMLSHFWLLFISQIKAIIYFSIPKEYYKSRLKISHRSLSYYFKTTKIKYLNFDLLLL